MRIAQPVECLKYVAISHAASQSAIDGRMHKREQGVSFGAFVADAVRAIGVRACVYACVCARVLKREQRGSFVAGAVSARPPPEPRRPRVAFSPRALGWRARTAFDANARTRRL